MGIFKKDKNKPTANDGKSELTADMIESLRQAAAAISAKEQAITPHNAPGILLDEQATVKLVDYICHPDADRESELTSLNHVQAYAFALLMVFEEAARRHNGEIPDLMAVFRRASYRHRRSVNALLLKELADLAGLQSQEEAMKNQGVGSPLGI